MKKCGLAAILLLILIAVVGSTGMKSMEAAEKTGEQLFVEHCVMCHPDGGNIINPKKTLLKKDLAANNIKTADAVIKLMRKPGTGMTAFSTSLISDTEARKISDYIFKKFN
ncbi:MAG: c-type cytochrome [Nitrospirota bacterium]